MMSARPGAPKGKMRLRLEAMTPGATLAFELPTEQPARRDRQLTLNRQAAAAVGAGNYTIRTTPSRLYVTRHRSGGGAIMSALATSRHHLTTENDDA